MERVCVCLCIYVSKCADRHLYGFFDSKPADDDDDAAMLVFLKLKCHSITIFRVAIKCDQNRAEPSQAKPSQQRITQKICILNEHAVAILRLIPYVYLLQICLHIIKCNV